MEYTTATLAQRYGCSKSAMRHRILRNVALLNRDGVHALQDENNQWNLDIEGVRILDRRYPVQYDAIETQPKIISMHTNLELLDNKLNNMQEQLDKLTNLFFEKFEHNNKESETLYDILKSVDDKIGQLSGLFSKTNDAKTLDSEIRKFCEKDVKNATPKKVRRTGMTWKSQVMNFIEHFAENNNLEKYEAYQQLYASFKEKTGIDVYEMKDMYVKTHQRQIGSKKISILEALNHNELAALSFTEFLNTLV